MSSGRTSATRRNCASCCSVNGGLSGSRKAPAWTAASSSGVVRSISSRAMRRASSPLLGPVDMRSLRLSLIEPPFRRLGLAQANHPDHFATIVSAFREHQHVEARADKSDRLRPKLAIILAVINPSYGEGPVEFIDCCEIDTMVPQILPALDFIPIVPHSPHPIHIYLCMQLNELSRAAKTRPPYHRIAAAPRPRIPRAPRTRRRLPPPPQPARPARASRHHAQMQAPSRPSFCRRADRGTPARTARPDALARAGSHRGEKCA